MNNKTKQGRKRWKLASGNKIPKRICSVYVDDGMIGGETDFMLKCEVEMCARNEKNLIRREYKAVRLRSLRNLGLSLT